MVKGIGGFRLTHQQALAAQAVALAGGSPPRVVTYAEVAPVAMMLGTGDLLRAWVRSTLGRLATDDEHHARLRETLLVFLDTGGSYKATAERLVLHKNSVQYRIHKATRASAARSATTATTSSSRSRPAAGSARRSSSRPPDGTYAAHAGSRRSPTGVLMSRSSLGSNDRHNAIALNPTREMK